MFSDSATHSSPAAFLPAGSYVVEHKTTALDIGPGSTYWKRLVLDTQISNYVDGSRALGHHDLRGVIYDVIKKPGLRPSKATPLESRKYTIPSSKACPECKKKKSEPAPHVVDGLTCSDGRIVTDPGGKLYASMRAEDETPEEYRARLIEAIGNDPEAYYQRGEVVRLSSEERANDADVWAIADQIRTAQKSGRWPRNPDACDAYGSFCTYWPVCSGEAAITDDSYYRDADQHEELEGSKVHEASGEPVVGQSGAIIGETQRKRKLPLLTTSSQKSFRSCQRKYFYAYELRRRSAHTSEVLRFGTLMHKGLEVWWKTCDLDLALAAMAGESDPFDRVRAEVLLMGYHARWFAEPFEVIAVETEFVAPLVNPETGRTSRTWMRGGKMDALARVSA